MEPHPQEQRLPIRPGSSLPRDRHVFHTRHLEPDGLGSNPGPATSPAGRSWASLNFPIPKMEIKVMPVPKVVMKRASPWVPQGCGISRNLPQGTGSFRERGRMLTFAEHLA